MIRNANLLIYFIKCFGNSGFSTNFNFYYPYICFKCQTIGEFEEYVRKIRPSI